MAMRLLRMLLKVIRGQHPRGVVRFARTRVILYSFTFITSLLSTLFFTAAIALHASTVASDPGFVSYNADDAFIVLSIVPQLWSAVWSFIVLRSLLNAISHSSTSLSTNPTTSAATDTEPLTDSTAASANRDSSKPPKHQSRHCCCCTCSPWLVPTTGPHPVFVLCIELFLWLSLVVIVTIFGLLFSNVARETIFYGVNHNCPVYSGYPPGTPRRLRYYCLDAYRHVMGLEMVALVSWGLCVTGHLVALVIACVLVHRWRGETGRKRMGRTERRKRGSGGVHAVDGQGGWIEMGRGRDPK